MYLSKRYNIPTNKYKVKAGQDQVRGTRWSFGRRRELTRRPRLPPFHHQEFWESKGWIDPQDPRGWFQW